MWVNQEVQQRSVNFCFLMRTKSLLPRYGPAANHHRPVHAAVHLAGVADDALVALPWPTEPAVGLSRCLVRFTPLQVEEREDHHQMCRCFLVRPVRFRFRSKSRHFVLFLATA